MTRKLELFLPAWSVYALLCFLIMIIGFDWKVSIPVSVVVGFICGLFNEIIHLLLSIRDEIVKANKQVDK